MTVFAASSAQVTGGKAAGGKCLKKNGLYTIGSQIKQNYAFAYGYVYNSASPSSGVGASKVIRIK